MADCPALDVLVAVLTPNADDKLVAHVESCLACQGVLALHGDRDRASAEQDEPCARAEVWIAERQLGDLPAADGASLAEHLLDCAGCRGIAGASDD